VKQIDHFYNLFFDRLSRTESFQNFLERIEYYKEPFSVGGIQNSSLSLFLHSFYRSVATRSLVVLPTSAEAEDIRDDLEHFLGPDSVGFLPDPDMHTDLFADIDKISTYFYNDCIDKLLCKSPLIIIATEKSLSAKLPTPKSVISNKIFLRADRPFNRDELIKTLVKFGYQRETTVEYPLEFCVKGSIVDIYPPSAVMPYRVEFFEDRVESIRMFNQENQISVRKCDEISISPASSAFLKEDESGNIFSYLERNSVFFIAHHDSHEYALIPPGSLCKRVFLNDLLETDIAFSFEQPVFQNIRFHKFEAYLSRQFEKYPAAQAYLFSDNRNQVERLRSLTKLPNLHIVEAFLSHSVECPDLGFFFYTDNDVYSRVRKSSTFKNLSRELSVQPIETEDIAFGDFMVHVNYGIGKYTGLEIVSVFGAERECLALEYQGGDKVLVPLERLRDVQKYKAAEGISPVLNKLGSSDWEKTKLRTRRSVEEVTTEIIQLYADRLQSAGFSFSADSALQTQVESEFIYEETPDQITATREIKTDMESALPMDRLLCGDVGFGKTEVAIRAAFKCVSDSKQVAILVPTTILADQHFSTFQERLKNYPVNVALVSRFVSRKELSATFNSLKTGRVDIVIGTHRLLSEDISFYDLGLLIVDEEHRFGVKHKDRIKKIRANFDVLSLSATPIPRTLQFSLIGARDFSLINTPPKSRLPIMTEIITFDKNLIVGAVYREVSRGGQIYFVHNEIKSIHVVTSKLREMFPDLTIEFAHGQMKENEIEPIMKSFIEEKIDMLVSTAIIESGIDIPNVNTIFINRAHTFGLAQLYQLRGRVGRGSRRAYAYLIVTNPSRLQPHAIKRLQTIQRYTSLGSGYSVALKDLEIRGAGNIFGVEQSGSIQAVGYDLYMQILKETIDAQKLDVSEEPSRRRPLFNKVEILYPNPALFPETYIATASLRLDLYHRLSECEDIENIDRLEAEITDRFGKIPNEGNAILEISRIRVLCSWLGFKKCIYEKNLLKFVLSEKTPFESLGGFFERVKSVCEQLRFSHKYTPGDRLQLIIFHKGEITFFETKQFLFILFDAVNL